MATIPGIIWVLVGVLIAGTSAYLGGLMPFLIIGVGFISFGGYKILINYMTKPKENKIDRKHEGIQKQASQKFCSNCGSPAQTKANFCNRCGKQV